MKQLVVNADDFGMSNGINKGILDGHRRGILTSTTILANGDAFSEAVIIARSAPGLGIGVHLNLSQGKPLSEPAAVASLVDKRGEFFPHPVSLLGRHVSGRLRPDEIERELSAQIEKVRATGIAITHLDGHKHVHMLPGIFPTVVRLAKQFGIAGVRCASERSPNVWALFRQNGAATPTISMQYMQSCGLGLIARGSRARLREAGLNFPQDFYGITQTGFLDDRQFAAILRTLRDGTSELMCHPGYADENMLRTRTRLLTERQRELDALMRPDILQLVAQLGIHLIDYRGVSSPNDP